jgi:metallophosphoesterase superfamily enzyme
MRGRALRRRCFALSARRCVMPAMGAYAGGLNLRDGAFRPLLGPGFSAHLLGDARLFRMQTSGDLPPILQAMMDEASPRFTVRESEFVVDPVDELPVE